MLVNTQAFQHNSTLDIYSICGSTVYTYIFCTFRNAFNEIEFNVGL